MSTELTAPGASMTTALAYDTTFAEELLKDGASYQEVANTVGAPVSRVRREFPGYAWENTFASSFTAQTRKLWKRVAEVWSIYE